MRRAIFIAALLIAAAPVPEAAAKTDCENAISSMDMDYCAGLVFNASDAKLNALYKTMMSKYDAPNQTVLKAAQRDWVKFRDSECIYESNLTAGGTINSMMVTECKTNKTNARIKDLNAQLHCPEGDMSCNAPQ